MRCGEMVGGYVGSLARYDLNMAMYASLSVTLHVWMHTCVYAVK